MEAEEKLAEKVNQWMFVTSNGSKSMLEYFYNSGSLNARGIRNHFYHVVFNLDLVGFKVLGLCSDAGGSNAGFFNMMRSAGSKGKSTEAWLPTIFVSFPHSLSDERSSCGAHVLKSNRNQLLKELATGFMLDHKNRPLSWKYLVEIHRLDKRRDTRFTRLTDEALYPQTHEKMSVYLRKVVFEENTLTSMVAHCAQVLNIVPLTPTKEYIYEK